MGILITITKKDSTLIVFLIIIYHLITLLLYAFLPALTIKFFLNLMKLYW